MPFSFTQMVYFSSSNIHYDSLCTSTMAAKYCLPSTPGIRFWQVWQLKWGMLMRCWQLGVVYVNTGLLLTPPGRPVLPGLQVWKTFRGQILMIPVFGIGTLKWPYLIKCSSDYNVWHIIWKLRVCTFRICKKLENDLGLDAVQKPSACHKCSQKQFLAWS